MACPVRNGPICDCHGEPAYWNRDLRATAGGNWYCAVKKREAARQHYDSDPVYRISKSMKADAKKRRATVERRKERLRGEVQD